MKEPIFGSFKISEDMFFNPLNIKLNLNKMKLEAIPITHVDVHGKQIHYIKVTNGINVKFVHVVKRVYDDVKELETHVELPKLPFDETENDEGTQSNVQTGDTEEKGTEPEKLEGIRPVRGPRNGRNDK